jgi:hypothetical protein
MKQRIRKERKNYAMLRMVEAIGRAIDSTSPREQERAARWVAAWGAMSGIRTPGVRLRRDILNDERRRHPRPPKG